MANTSPWCHQHPHLSLASHMTENIDSFRHETLNTSILSVIFIPNLIQRTPCSASPCPHLNCHTTFCTLFHLLFLLSCISMCSSLLCLFLCLHMCLRNPCSILPPSYSYFPQACCLLPLLSYLITTTLLKRCPCTIAGSRGCLDISFCLFLQHPL